VRAALRSAPGPGWLLGNHDELPVDDPCCFAWSAEVVQAPASDHFRRIDQVGRAVTGWPVSGVAALSRALARVEGPHGRVVVRGDGVPLRLAGGGQAANSRRQSAGLSALGKLRGLRPITAIQASSAPA